MESLLPIATITVIPVTISVEPISSRTSEARLPEAFVRRLIDWAGSGTNNLKIEVEINLRQYRRLYNYHRYLTAFTLDLGNTVWLPAAVPAVSAPLDIGRSDQGTFLEPAMLTVMVKSMSTIAAASSSLARHWFWCCSAPPYRCY